MYEHILYERRGRLLASMVFHGVNNAVAVSVAILHAYQVGQSGA